MREGPPVPFAAYDRIGTRYRRHRRPDPRIAAQVLAALGDASTVLNVGAGTGSYEPRDRRVVAVEPSMIMIRQRPADGAPVVQACAESLPFPKGSFDALQSILSVHHWADRAAGLAECIRIAPRRVLLMFEPAIHNAFWLLDEYLPAAATLEAARAPTVAEVAHTLDAHRVEVVPVPHDCIDGFGWAYWRRPEMYLDENVRACISMLAALSRAELDPGLARLERDIRSGAWEARHRDLLERDTIDGGFRLVIAEDP